MPLLSVDARLAKYKAAGYEVLHYVAKPAAEKAGETSSDSLDAIAAAIEDGFYQVVQLKDDSSAPLTATPKNSGGSLTSESVLPVVMSSNVEFLDPFFKLTRQYGITNGFTIVPVCPPIPPSNPELGATTKDISDKLNIQRSAEYPIWVLRCDKTATIRDKDDHSKTFTVNYFRLLKAGSTKCWKTGSEAKDPPISISVSSYADNELYEIIRSDVEQTVTINEVEKLQAQATSGNIVKKFYFSTGVLSADKAKAIVALQLSTSAHNQGWATFPKQGLWSWFEIAILTKDLKLGNPVTDSDIKKVDGKLLTFESHRIPLTNNYTNQDGPIFAKDHELLKHVEKGNVIAVLACAQYNLWACNAGSGSLKIRELVSKP